jgi:hypothetical protein
MSFPTPETCPEGPHRGPEGPNEDLAQCPRCLAPDHAPRPADETYGLHLDDCSLPVDHGSYCVGGGQGHPPAETIRGYWPGLDAQVRLARLKWEEASG